jgi:hypothetical protein
VWQRGRSGLLLNLRADEAVLVVAWIKVLDFVLVVSSTIYLIIVDMNLGVTIQRNLRTKQLMK